MSSMPRRRTEAQAPQDESPREGLAKRMKTVIASLDSATDRMQNAIVTQNVPEIWNVLSDQERIAAEFQQCACLWGHLLAAGRGTTEIEASIKEMNKAFDSVKRKNKCNMALIKNFLSSVDRSLRASGTQSAKNANIYGRRGKLQRSQSSLVLNREG